MKPAADPGPGTRYAGRLSPAEAPAPTARRDGNRVRARPTITMAIPANTHAKTSKPVPVAANVVARAIARGVYNATALPFAGALPAWKDRFG